MEARFGVGRYNSQRLSISEPIGGLILILCGLVESNHFAAVEFILSLDDSQFARLDGMANNLTLCLYVMRTLINIFLDRRLEEILALGVAFRSRYSWINLLNDRIQVGAGHLFTGACGIDGTALLMSKHDEQRTVEMFHRILDASQGHGIGDISRGAHYKDVSQTLIENQFGTDTAVRTGQDYRFRRLSGDQLVSK